MSFAEGNPQLPSATTTVIDTSNDWGYFVDCDQQYEEIIPMAVNKVERNITIPEGPQEGTILEL